MLHIGYIEFLASAMIANRVSQYLASVTYNRYGVQSNFFSPINKGKQEPMRLTLLTKDVPIYAVYDDGLIIRQTIRSDLKTLEDLHAKQEAVSRDFEVAFDSMEDKSGFFTGEYEGRPVAFVMTIKWANNPSLSYSGGFVCDKRFRNRLFGWRLMEVTLNNYL